MANQGWKDTGDSIRWRDGSIAKAPIALVEAQAYAVEALRGAARLYRAFDVPDGESVAAAADAREGLRPAPFGAMRVEGLRFLGGRVDLDVAADGSVEVLDAPEGVTVAVL